jgi:hypothetical protein
MKILQNAQDNLMADELSVVLRPTMLPYDCK